MLIKHITFHSGNYFATFLPVTFIFRDKIRISKREPIVSLLSFRISHSPWPLTITYKLFSLRQLSVTRSHSIAIAKLYKNVRRRDARGALKNLFGRGTAGVYFADASRSRVNYV